MEYNFLEKPNCTDTKVRNICYRVIASKGVMLCLDLGIFEYIGTIPSSIDDIARKFSLKTTKVEALISICCAEKLMLKKEALYYLTQVAIEYFFSKSPYYYGDFIKLLYIELDSSRNYPDIKKSICTNSPAKLGTRLFEEEFYSSNIANKFAYAMHSKSIAPSKFWPDYIDLSNKKLFIDIGGGIGTHAIAVCKKFETLNAIVLEKNEIVNLGNEFINHHNLNNRIKFLECDFFTDEIPNADVYFLSDILHDWDDNKCLYILQKIFKKLKKNSILIIHEIFFNKLKTGSWGAAAYNFSMTVFSEGQQYSKNEIFKKLRQVGLKDIKYKKTFGDWGIIIATKHI